MSQNENNLPFWIGLILLVVVIGAIVVLAFSGGAKGQPVFTYVQAEGLGVFSAANSSEVLTQIDWGEMRPGQYVEKTCYIVTNVTSYIDIYTLDWRPENLTEYFVFNYSMPSAEIRPYEFYPLIFGLYLNWSLPKVENNTAFSFNVSIVQHQLPDAYVQDFMGWQIYRVEEAYLQEPANRLLPRFIAIHPEKHAILSGVDLPDLLADIEEAER